MTTKKYLNFIKTFFFSILLLSIIFVGSSVFWTKDFAHSYEDLISIELGFPLTFISTDFSSRYDLDDFSHMAKDGLPVEISYGVSFFQLISWLTFALIFAIPYLYMILIEIITTADFSFSLQYFPIFSWVSLFINLIIVFLIFSYFLFLIYSIFPQLKNLFKFFGVKYILGSIILLLLANYLIRF